MEISIDFATVRRLLKEEYAQARAGIAQAGPVAALAGSQVRHDDCLAAASDAQTLACRDGCAWCCHFTVDVRAVEVFGILDFVTHHFSPARQAALRDEIEINSREVALLSEEQRMRRTAKCPFLEMGRCTIYSVRPQTCRNYHATDAAGCRQSFEEPGNLDIDPEFAPMVYQSGGAHVEGFSAAMQDAGFDTAAYELNQALAAALRQPEESRRRFADGLKPFTKLSGEAVPAEFAED